jgi:hypothetical protein
MASSVSNIDARYDIFSLVACQRSGTHLLREMLNSSPWIALAAEPFSPGANPMLWQNYVRTLSPENYPPPTFIDARALLDRYMHLIENDIEQNSDWYGGPKPQLKAIGLDVKYDQLKCVVSLYSDLRDLPILLKYFRKRNVRIIHLVRENLVHTAISNLIALDRKVWDNYEGTLIRGKYHLCPNELMKYISWIKNEREEFEALCDELTVQACCYEDLVDDISRVDGHGYLPENSKVLAPIADFLGVPNRFRYNGWTKKVINRPYSDVIENYDEIVATIEGSDVAELAATL